MGTAATGRTNWRRPPQPGQIVGVGKPVASAFHEVQLDVVADKCLRQFERRLSEYIRVRQTMDETHRASQVEGRAQHQVVTALLN